MIIRKLKKKNRYDNNEGFIFTQICLIRIVKSQEKTLAEKQKMAQQIRDETRVQIKRETELSCAQRSREIVKTCKQWS